MTLALLGILPPASRSARPRPMPSPPDARATSFGWQTVAAGSFPHRWLLATVLRPVDHLGLLALALGPRPEPCRRPACSVTWWRQVRGPARPARPGSAIATIGQPCSPCMADRDREPTGASRSISLLGALGTLLPVQADRLDHHDPGPARPAATQSRPAPRAWPTCYRPGAANRRLWSLSLGLGLTVLVANALIEGNMALPNRPRACLKRPPANFYFIDIQPDQVEDLRQAPFRAVPGVSRNCAACPCCGAESRRSAAQSSRGPEQSRRRSNGCSAATAA